jgi:ABC-type Na+ efflux pump permease subunit
MNKFYLFGPLVALIIFIGVYTVHRGGMKEREAQKITAAEAALKTRLETEQESRRVAMADAIKAAEQRRADRAAREAREAAQREERQAAIDARDRAFRDQDRLAKQIERLKRDIETEEAALAKIAAESQAAEAEKAFLAEFVTKAQANVQALQILLTRLNATPAPTPAPTR